MEVTVPCHEVWKRCMARRHPEAVGGHCDHGVTEYRSRIFIHVSITLSRRGRVPVVLMCETFVSVFAIHYRDGCPHS